ncbi:uncharacterized protein LOC110641631 isoform X2 [Hevea brasiliensis]|uniref:uncharacterized protein LOC110641631 isoform X2 n=1 Tax=Hevea brasiliensis TaxID=3981 RepID=UPI0025FC1F2B|nr:uncharacterized protein LOC110641631 isoform X2 [Hevea brasiliensis]
MGETDMKGTSMEAPNTNSMGNGVHRAFDPSFLVQLPNKLQNCLKSQLRKLAKDKEESPSVRKEEGSATALRIDLERQLQSWRENPSWVDQPPEIKEVISRKVLLDEGPRQLVELEQAAIWKFLWWSGTISVHVLVDQNRQDLTMKFKQVQTGFMKKFEGCWRVEPVFVDECVCHPFKPKTWIDYYSCTEGKGRIGSKVSLEQIIQPTLVPPPPISWYLRGITSRTTEMIVNDLIAEAARIRGDFSTAASKGSETSKDFDYEHQNYKLCGIKERWAQHRRNAKRRRRRLLTAE